MFPDANLDANLGAILDAIGLDANPDVNLCAAYLGARGKPVYLGWPVRPEAVCKLASKKAYEARRLPSERRSLLHHSLHSNKR